MAKEMSLAKQRWELIQDPLRYFLAGLGLLTLTFGVLTGFFYLSAYFDMNDNAIFMVGVILSFPAAAGLFFGVSFALIGFFETLYGLCTGRSSF
jgi:hypothetical protein